MSARNPCFVLLNGGAHPADTFRRALGSLISTPGVAGLNDLQVTQNGGGTTLTVNVAAGNVTIAGTQASDQGTYECYNDASVTLTIASNSSGNPRNDLIVAQVLDDQYSGGTHVWQLAVVQGTPAVSPSDPATPANGFVLARVRVASGATGIVTSNITDLRRRVILVQPFHSNTLGPPTYGTWNQGDTFLDSSYTEWICTVAGTPGTWQTFNPVKLASQTVTSVASITFSSINPNFRHLQLRWNLIAVGGTNNPSLQFNGDSTPANYVWASSALNSASAGAQTLNGSSSGALLFLTSLNTTRYGGGEAEIQAYTALQARNLEISAMRGDGFTYSLMGAWLNTAAAITSIAIVSSANTMTGTVDLWGIP